MYNIHFALHLKLTQHCKSTILPKQFKKMVSALYALVRSSLLGGLPGGSEGEESACNAGDLGSIPGLERDPGGG